MDLSTKLDLIPPCASARAEGITLRVWGLGHAKVNTPEGFVGGVITLYRVSDDVLVSSIRTGGSDSPRDWLFRDLEPGEYKIQVWGQQCQPTTISQTVEYWLGPLSVAKTYIMQRNGDVEVVVLPEQGRAVVINRGVKPVLLRVCGVQEGVNTPLLPLGNRGTRCLGSHAREYAVSAGINYAVSAFDPNVIGETEVTSPTLFFRY